ncbi:putative signal transducing protein [Leptothrix discophora]|uniref:DUF2007 domain-containing protein n=1 Tax=Leptothrix discophora TaxID=89 RepID=A0ABT9G7U2_LEPDI|nr:DUF2007 domain-containing protein [Leptothrix discophora]MDP4302490.1 DUF2007 domain-containing protein [Leptothrix discophora]
MDKQAGDFVRIATCATPTEAHLMQGMLASVGLSARVADANFIQADPWMTQAVGGVRVLVPADEVDAARRALADYDGGALALPDEDPDDTPTASVQRPDASRLLPAGAWRWGFVLLALAVAAGHLARSWFAHRPP